MGRGDLDFLLLAPVYVLMSILCPSCVNRALCKQGGELDTKVARPGLRV